MKRIAGTSIRLVAGIAMAAFAAGPASATFYASSQLCYGADCSEQGYDEPESSVSEHFQRDVGESGSLDLTASAAAAARQVTFDVAFQGSQLEPDVFLGSTPQRPYGSLVLLAFMGAVAEDTLTITAPGLASGYVSLDVLVEAGGVNGCTAVGGCSAPVPFVSPNLDAQFFAQANSQSAGGGPIAEAAMTAVGGFAELYESGQIAFMAGTPFSVRVGVSGTIGLRDLLDPNPPQTFISGASLGVTATIVRLHVYDASRAPIASADIASATGTDWTTVPEAPHAVSGVIVALALGGVASVRSRSSAPAAS